MPYDPNYPPANAPLQSAPMRTQFNALKALNDSLAAQVAALQAQVNNLQNDLNNQIGGTARNPNGQFGNFDPNWQPNGGGWDINDLYWLRDRMNELYNAEAR